MSAKPFPQFEDDVFETPGTLVSAIIAWDASHAADRPHVVLVYDPETKRLSAFGPYPTGYRANEAAEGIHAELNDPKNNDGPPITVTVVPLLEPDA